MSLLLLLKPSGGGGSTAYTLTGLAGSYSLSGGSALLRVGRKITANSGAYSLTGGNATLTKTSGPVAYTLTALAGAYSVTGGNAGLKVGRSLIGNSGGYSLTGGSATLTKSASSVAYSLTGLAGVYSLSGGNASLNASRNLIGLSGAYSFTGSSATLTKTTSGAGIAYSLTAEPSQYVISGGNAQMDRGISMVHGGPSRYEKGSYWHKLLSPPTIRKIEELEQEVPAVLQVVEVASQVVRQPQPPEITEAKASLERLGLYTQSYFEIYLELVAEMRQAQEDEQIAAIVAALL